MDKVSIQIINKSNYPLPEYQTKGSAGIDLYANLDEITIIKKGEIKLIPTGIFLSMPIGYEGQVRSRSGLSLDYGIVVANGIGTIDSDYRGEIKVILINLGKSDFEITPGMRVAQMVFNKITMAKFELVENLGETKRGEDGFGHSGR